MVSGQSDGCFVRGFFFFSSVSFVITGVCIILATLTELIDFHIWKVILVQCECNPRQIWKLAPEVFFSVARIMQTPVHLVASTSMCVCIE